MANRLKLLSGPKTVIIDFMKNHRGFTVVEIIVAICVLTIVGILGFTNIHDLQAHNRDSQLKTSVNATQYQLQAFFETNKYYPQNLNNKDLPGLDPIFLKDTNKITINQPGSALSYATKTCKQNKCQAFKLTAQLEKEGNYTKTNSDKLN